MAFPTGSIHEIRWNELCPWLVLAKSWRVSLLVRVLAYAWVGLLLTQWGWKAIQYFSTGADQPERTLSTTHPEDVMDIRELRASERRLVASSLFQVDGFTALRTRSASTEPHPLAWLRTHLARHSFGPLVEGWRALSRPFVRTFQFNASLSEVMRQLICGLWAIAVWAICGAAIARTSARYCTREEIINPLAAGRAALTTWPSTAGAPLIPLLFAALLTIPLAFLGLVMRADLLAMFGGIFWLISLIWGFGIAVVLIAVWFGWPMMWATVAVERSDAFDAASRTAAYVYQRPLKLIFYVIVASLLGMVGYIIVAGFSAAANYVTDWSVSWGSGGQRMLELAGANDGVEPTFAGSAAIAAESIRFWKSMLTTLAAAYPLAYLFSSSVGIYLLLRLDIDATEMDEIGADTSEDQLPHEQHLDDSTTSGSG